MFFEQRIGIFAPLLIYLFNEMKVGLSNTSSKQPSHSKWHFGEVDGWKSRRWTLGKLTKLKLCEFSCLLPLVNDCYRVVNWQLKYNTVQWTVSELYRKQKFTAAPFFAADQTNLDSVMGLMIRALEKWIEVFHLLMIYHTHRCMALRKAIDAKVQNRIRHKVGLSEGGIWNASRSSGINNIQFPYSP